MGDSSNLYLNLHNAQTVLFSGERGESAPRPFHIFFGKRAGDTPANALGFQKARCSSRRKQSKKGGAGFIQTRSVLFGKRKPHADSARALPLSRRNISFFSPKKPVCIIRGQVF